MNGTWYIYYSHATQPYAVAGGESVSVGIVLKKANDSLSIRTLALQYSYRLIGGESDLAGPFAAVHPVLKISQN